LDISLNYYEKKRTLHLESWPFFKIDAGKLEDSDVRGLQSFLLNEIHMKSCYRKKIEYAPSEEDLWRYGGWQEEVEIRQAGSVELLRRGLARRQWIKAIGEEAAEPREVLWREAAIGMVRHRIGGRRG
jgi:hypothetical protein